MDSPREAGKRQEWQMRKQDTRTAVNLALLGRGSPFALSVVTFQQPKQVSGLSLKAHSREEMGGSAKSH